MHHRHGGTDGGVETPAVDGCMYCGTDGGVETPVVDDRAYSGR